MNQITDSELRVLRVLRACIAAMAELSDDDLRDETQPPTPAFAELAKAELARRDAVAR